MKPPKIVHLNYTLQDDMVDIAEKAATALHMGKGERALLTYYARQSAGFQPALQAIANATGQNRSQVYRNRLALEEHGIVAEKNGCIYIDWARLRLYASLDPKLTSKRCLTAPFGDVKREVCRITLDTFLVSEPTELIERLAVLTDEEYASLQQRLKEERRKCLCIGIPTTGTKTRTKTSGTTTSLTTEMSGTCGTISTTAGSWLPEEPASVPEKCNYNVTTLQDFATKGDKQ